ncbi:MAG TPA: SusC/RagA family TonB-linked outer membrane protein, partial [Chitinophagaceae bacterium]|nr:SusC/RagA family TonB-linked outer membrane protein [Chitinophagaceae bacterium]
MQDNFPYPGKVVPGPNGDYYARGPNDYIGLTRDWQDEIFRTGIYQNYSVNISGGNEAGSHSLSFNYLNQDGTIVNSAYSRYGLNLNLNRSLGKIFKVGTSTSFANSTTNGVKTGTDKSDDANAGVIRSALTYPSTIDSIGAFNLNGGQGYFITNPSIYARDVLNRVKGLNIFSSNYLEAVITKNFKFRQNLGFNYASNTRDQYYPRTVYEGFSAKGWGLKADDVWNSLVSESMVTYAGKLKKHSLNVLAASTYEKTNGQWKRVEAKTFPNDLLKNENLEAGEQKMPVISNRYQSTLISFLGRVNYSFDDKYLLTVSYRQDGSSKFGRDNKWAGFPSMAIAWKIVNEDFMRSFKAINDLKLRLSYGQTGNQGIGSYSSLSKLKVYNYPFNGALQTGLADDVYAGPANDKLKWETTDAYNAGLDLGMFNNRLVIHADVYLKKTNDLLQFVTTPPSTGYPQKLINSGSVENKGVEFSVEGIIVRGHDFEWNSNFNISFNRNKILSLGPDVKEQYAGPISTGDAPFIQKVGHPIGAVYGWVEDGYYDNEAEIRSDPFYATQPEAIIRRTVGEIKYKNLDGKTDLTNDDRTFIGDVNPDYTFGFTNIFRYKNFDLNVFVNGVQGNDIINMNTRFNSNLGDNKNITQAQYEHAWTTDADNTNATGPKVIHQFWRALKFTRRFIEDGSFVRIKNITLGYNIKTKLAGISSLRVSVGVNNLYTFTKYTGYDPEINSYGDNPALYGVDLGGYPNSRAYNFTLRCSF